jgi:hypothetical protein
MPTLPERDHSLLQSFKINYQKISFPQSNQHIADLISACELTSMFPLNVIVAAQ